MYIELHASSAFSFLDGAALPEALIERAGDLGYPALALVDRDGLSGAPRFHLAAKRAGIKAIVGAALTVAGDGGRGAPAAERRVFTLPVLVESRSGYRNLCRLITAMKLRAPKGEGALTFEDLDGQTSGLIALVGRTAIDGPRYGVGGLVDRLVGTFGASQLYIELQRHLLREQEWDNQALLELGSAFHVPVVATNGVRFAEAADRPLYDVLTCIRHKTTIDRAGRRLTWNAERYLKPPGAMARLFSDLPRAVTATRELAERIGFTMEDLGYRFPVYPVPPGESMGSFLRKMTQAGARERYRPYDDRARRQIERELALIDRLGLAGYFLIVWDIVNYCRQHGILVQGRGSAANSAVCYSLGITAVDPIGMELLFERFLSEERGEWPDIDLDLPSGDRREQVIQHVYAKYGKFGAAMTANVITYRGRSAAREVGKVLSLEPSQIDRLAKVMNGFEWIDPQETLDRNLRAAGIDSRDARVQLFGRLWQRIQDLPRHLGQHSGGMVMCHDRLDEIVPLENASMPDRVVIQWDKDDCADMGLIKIDLLGLGMMAVIQDALQLVNAGVPDPASPGPALRSPCLDLAHMPPDDPAVYRMLQEADTVGIFQVESRAQMATLPRLRPQCFYDIVVEVAIIRPGPIVGQMVHPYLKRRQGSEPVTYPHPSLEPILRRTLGVPLFQEQLLRMAMVAAGFSGGEAEELRRAFGFKRSEKRMQQIEGKLRAGMARQGITGEAAEGIIRAITSFALYGFPESHAASFALIVYASAYLKAHYPAAFYTAMLNNQPMGFYHPATLVKDAQRHGVRFAPVDVQTSDWECRVDPDGRVRLGLMYVKGLRQEIGTRIARARDAARHEHCTPRVDAPGTPRCPKCGCDDPSMLESAPDDGLFCNICAHEWGSPTRAAARPASPAPVPDPADPPRFTSLEELIARTGIRRDELAALAGIGALNAFGHHRRSALWQIERAMRPAGELFESDRGSAPDPGSSLAGAQRPAPLLAGAPCAPPLGGWHRAQDSRSGPHSGSEASHQLTGAGSQLPGAGGHSPAPDHRSPITDHGSVAHRQPPAPSPQSPLRPMTPAERLLADYAGTSLTIGPHPLALRRMELAMRGVLRAADLPHGNHGRRVRVAGAVITRQRPGTAKGFVFLTLEDETGIANIIVRPDLFSEQRAVILGAPYVLIEGALQIQEGVTSVKAERVLPLTGDHPEPSSHDFR